MNTTQAIARVKTILTLGGCGNIDAAKVIEVMTKAGTWSEGQPRVDLKAMNAAVATIRSEVR